MPTKYDAVGTDSDNFTNGNSDEINMTLFLLFFYKLPSSSRYETACSYEDTARCLRMAKETGTTHISFSVDNSAEKASRCKT